jgi:hypothetical protein
MARATDLLYGSDGDLLIVNGDFVIGESEEQHMEDIILAAPGEFRQYPTLGVGISRYLKGPDPNLDRLKAAIIENLKLDGYTNISVALNPDDLTDIDLKADRK